MNVRPISVYGGRLANSTFVRNHADSTDGTSAFKDFLQKASATLESLDQEAYQAQIDLATGNARDLHTASLAVEKASLALDLVIAVRNKALEAYQEIMRMPV